MSRRQEITTKKKTRQIQDNHKTRQRKTVTHTRGEHETFGLDVERRRKDIRVPVLKYHIVHICSCWSCLLVVMCGVSKEMFRSCLFVVRLVSCVYMSSLQCLLSVCLSVSFSLWRRDYPRQRQGFCNFQKGDKRSPSQARSLSFILADFCVSWYGVACLIVCCVVLWVLSWNYLVMWCGYNSCLRIWIGRPKTTRRSPSIQVEVIVFCLVVAMPLYV